MRVEIIRTDGNREVTDMPLRDIHSAIGCKYFDTVNLRDGRVMLVDDEGYESTPVDRGNNLTELVCVKARKPVNPEATKLYHSICTPGTTHQIVGDVAIVVDAECD